MCETTLKALSKSEHIALSCTPVAKHLVNVGSGFVLGGQSYPTPRGGVPVWYGIVEFNVPLDTA